jgi:hypothetical protein
MKNVGRFVMMAAVLCLITAPLTFAAEDTVDVSGAWSMTFQGRQGPVTMAMNLEQDGTKLTGALSGRQGRQMPLKGKVKGDKINFKVAFQTQRGEFEITYKGTVEGDEMKGTAQLPQNTVDWSATKQ